MGAETLTTLQGCSWGQFLRAIPPHHFNPSRVLTLIKVGARTGLTHDMAWGAGSSLRSHGTRFTLQEPGEGGKSNTEADSTHMGLIGGRSLSRAGGTPIVREAELRPGLQAHAGVWGGGTSPAPSVLLEREITALSRRRPGPAFKVSDPIGLQGGGHRLQGGGGEEEEGEGV